MDQGLTERCVHLVVLSSLVVTHPLLDLLARHGEFFVIRRLDRLDIVVLVGFLLLVVPLPGVILEVVLARAPIRAQRAVHMLLVGLYGFAEALLVGRRFSISSPVVVWLFAVAASIGFVLAYARFRAVKTFVSFLAVGLVAIPAAFFLKPQISRLLTLRASTMLELPQIECDAPVVFVVFDEFNTVVLLDDQGRINRNRYPNLARLASRSTWFTNAVTVSQSTEFALPAIVTGRRPNLEQKPWLEDYPNNIFTLFGGSYRVWSDEAFSSLCPPEINRRDAGAEPFGRRALVLVLDLSVVYLHLVLPQSVTEGLPTIDATWERFIRPGSLTAEPSTTESDPRFFRKALDALKDDRREVFERLVEATSTMASKNLYFAHVMLPHRPWEFLPDGRRYFIEQSSTPGISARVWGSHAILLQQAYQRYLLQTMYVDTQVGKLLDSLDRNGWFDRTLIVLVADHGISFSSGHHVRVIDERTAHEIALVPLLIKLPNQSAPQVVDHRVSVVDVLPTILDGLGQERPWPMDGRSRMGDDRPDTGALQILTKKRGWVEIGSDVCAQAREAVERKLRIFGDGSNPLDIYRFGPGRGLHGRPTSEIRILDELRWRISVDGREALETVDLLGDTLPVFLRGTLEGADLPARTHDLAIAINGRVAAATSTWAPDAGRQQFSVMLPPSFLRPGSNEIEVYAIVTRSGALALRRIPVL